MSSDDSKSRHLRDIEPGEPVSTTDEARDYYGSGNVRPSWRKATGFAPSVPSYHANGQPYSERQAKGGAERSAHAAAHAGTHAKGGASGGGKKKGSASRILSNVLIAVGVVLLAVAAGMWGYSQWQYSQQDAENAKLAKYATVSDDTSTPPVVDWASLKAINADVVGWIQIPGTVVNYPVYQGSDNDHYLNTNAEGVYGVGGQIFMDYLNTKPGLVDQQTLVYGHHLKNGAMFKQVADMDKQEFFDSVKTVWYVTEGNTYELEPLLLYYTDPDDTNVRKFSFADDATFHAYLNGLLGKAQTRNADAASIINGATRVLTLSTCNYYDGYGRTELVCVLKSEATAAIAASQKG
ncbi:MAG: class B sortase [Atopobiaceae bacterium]|nr:class B sortase [Atopobiaceae bacterium]